VTTTGSVPFPFEGMSAPNASNQTQVQATDASAATRTNTYQLPAPGAPTSFTYDADGNLTSDGTSTYEWDVLSRLRAVNQGTHRSEFPHQGAQLFQVIEKENSVVQSSTYYVWCGDERCEERAADGTAVTKRLFSQGLMEGPAKYFHARDHLGSIRELTDQAATVRARYDYDSYGRQTKLTGDKDVLFGFTGQQTHAPTGLYYYRARYYDPRLGRFLSEDPIGMSGGMDLYTYVANNVSNAIDRVLAATVRDRLRVTVG
jgi:RHS repeat-associated protein